MLNSLYILALVKWWGGSKIFALSATLHYQCRLFNGQNEMDIDQGRRVQKKINLMQLQPQAKQHKALFTWNKGSTMGMEASKARSFTCWSRLRTVLRWSDLGAAHLRFWSAGAMASHGNSHLLDAHSDTSAPCANKKLSTLSVRSAIENGSFYT